jgi:hypothetical protein
MMKKLLVLALVLGLTSSASAALSGIQLSVDGVTNGAGTIQEVTTSISIETVIDVHGPFGYDWLGYIIIEGDPPAGGEWGDDDATGADILNQYYTNQAYPIMHPGAGDEDLSGYQRYIEADWGWGYELSANSATNVPGGLQFEFIFHCLGPESEYMIITLWDDAQGYVTPQDTIVLHTGIIPEPMTITLLGLGGLFLLRRRK